MDINHEVIEGKVVQADVQHEWLVQPVLGGVFVRLEHPWVRVARRHGVVLGWERAAGVGQVGISMRVVCERC